MKWPDVNTQAGQFLTLLLIYLFVVLLRCAGFESLKEDHTLILGALLTLLRSHGNPAPPGA